MSAKSKSKLTYDDLCTNLVVEKTQIEQLCKYMGVTPDKISTLSHWNLLFRDYLNYVFANFHEVQEQEYDLNRDRARLAREQAMTHKVRRKKLAGELITIDQFKELVTRVCSIVSRDFDSIPRILRLKIKKIDQKIIDEVMEVMDMIRNKTAAASTDVRVHEVIQNTDITALQNEYDDSTGA